MYRAAQPGSNRFLCSRGEVPWGDRLPPFSIVRAGAGAVDLKAGPTGTREIGEHKAKRGEGVRGMNSQPELRKALVIALAQAGGIVISQGQTFGNTTCQERFKTRRSNSLCWKVILSLQRFI